MRNSTNLVLNKPGDGMFLASCFAHGDGLGVGPVGTTKIKGSTSAQGLGDWFHGRSNTPAILIDDCNMDSHGSPCNPTCGATPSPSPSPTPSPSPSPTPSPSPSPSPSPGTCAGKVQELCADSLSDVTSCLQCASAHSTELGKAGCSPHKVKAACGETMVV